MTTCLFFNQLRLNIISGAITTLINMITMGIGFPIYLHFLGYEKYGIWLILSTILTFAQLGNLGIGPAITKLVSEEHGRGSTLGIQLYVTNALVILCLSSVVVMTGMLLFKDKIIVLFNLTPDNASTVSMLFPYIAFLSIYVFFVQIMAGTLSGLGRMDLTNYIQTISQIIGILSSIVMLYNGLGVLGLFIGTAFSFLFNHILILIFIRRIGCFHFLRFYNFDIQRCKRLLYFGSGIFGGSLVSMLLSPFNKLIISRYIGVSSIAVYEISFTMIMQIRSLIEAGFRALMPEISYLKSDLTTDAKNRINEIYHSSIITIFLGFPCFIAIYIISPFLLTFWLGDRFVEILPGVFRVMLIGAYVSLTSVPAYYLLMGVGKIRQIFGSHIVCGLLNIFIIIYLIHANMLSIGAIAWSVTISLSGSTAYLIWWKVSYSHQINEE